MFKRVVPFLFLMISCSGCLAQTDSASAGIFYNTLGAQSPLFNGREYIDVSRTQGHPFFVSDQFAKGTIFLDGLIFREVPILYDIIQDEVILRNHENNARFVLNPMKLEAFILHRHHFVTISADLVNQLPPGIYDKLFDGKAVVLSKRRKVVDEKVSMTVSRDLVQKDLYYVVLNGTAHQVRNRRQLLQVFDAKRKEVREQLRKHKINYRKQPEAALIKAAEVF